MIAVLTVLSLTAATPVDYNLQTRGIGPSKPEDIKCSGDIIGYRTIADQVRYYSLSD